MIAGTFCQCLLKITTYMIVFFLIDQTQLVLKINYLVKLELSAKEFRSVTCSLLSVFIGFFL